MKRMSETEPMKRSIEAVALGREFLQQERDSDSFVKRLEMD